MSREEENIRKAAKTADYLTELLQKKYRIEHEDRGMWTDYRDRCWCVIFIVCYHWFKYKKAVPTGVIRYEAVNSDEFKKLDDPRRTFFNTLKFLKEEGIIIKNGKKHSYWPDLNWGKDKKWGK